MLKTSDGHLARVALCPPAWVPEAGIHRSPAEGGPGAREAGGRRWTTVQDSHKNVTFSVVAFPRERVGRHRAPLDELVYVRLRHALSQHGLQQRRLLRHRRRSRPRLHSHAFRAVPIRVVANRNLPKPTRKRARVRVRRRLRFNPTVNVAESPRERRARRLDANARAIPRRAKITRGGSERARLRRGESRAGHVRRRKRRASLRVHGFRRGGNRARRRSGFRILVIVRVRVGI